MGLRVKLIEAEQKKLQSQAMRLAKKLETKRLELAAAQRLEEGALLGYADGDEEFAALLERLYG